MDLGIGPQGRFKVSTRSALLDKGFYRTPTMYISHAYSLSAFQLSSRKPKIAKRARDIYVPQRQLPIRRKSMSGGGGFISNMQSSLRNNKNQLRDRKESSYRKLKLNLEGKAGKELSKEEKLRLKEILESRRKRKNRKMLYSLVISLAIVITIIKVFLTFIQR